MVTYYLDIDQPSRARDPLAGDIQRFRDLQEYVSKEILPNLEGDWSACELREVRVIRDEAEAKTLKGTIKVVDTTTSVRTVAAETHGATTKRRMRAGAATRDLQAVPLGGSCASRQRQRTLPRPFMPILSFIFGRGLEQSMRDVVQCMHVSAL